MSQKEQLERKYSQEGFLQWLKVIGGLGGFMGLTLMFLARDNPASPFYVFDQTIFDLIMIGGSVLFFSMVVGGALNLRSANNRVEHIQRRHC